MARILIVEDEAVPRMILSKVLTRDGHEVKDTATGSEAMDLAKGFQPEVLIADWLLCDAYNGLAVAEQVRRINPKVHILFFTGLPTHNLEQEAEHLRPFRFLEKPCEFETLRAAIQDALAGNIEPAPNRFDG